MEISSGLSPRRNHRDSERGHFEIESDRNVHHDPEFQSTSVLEILNEAIRIFRYNLTGFTCITMLLLCPLSAILLSNILVNESLVKKLNIKMLLIAQSFSLPLNPFIKQLSYRFSEMTVLLIMGFPLSITLSLLIKSAIIHSVDCTYARKIFDATKFFTFFMEIWKCLIYTFLSSCVVLVGSSTLFLFLVAIISVLLSKIGLDPDLVIYPVIIFGLVFCIVFANAILICKVAIVISVLENISGFEAFLRSRILVRGQTQLGISFILISTVCMVFIEGLFDHRVMTVSYGDGSSRLWEGPLLVSMYAFVVLIDEMVSTVFYFNCKIYRTVGLDKENEPVLAEE